MPDKNISIIIKAKDQASAAITAVQGKVKGMGSSIVSSLGGVKTAALAAAVVIAAVVAGIAKLTQAGASFIKEWSQVEDGITRLNNALARHGYEVDESRKKVVEFSSSMQSLYGADADTALAQTQKLIDSNYSLDQSMELVRSSIALAIRDKGGDVKASQDLIDAYAKIGKGHEMGARALKAYGVILGKGATAQTAYAKTMEQSAAITDTLSAKSQTTSAKIDALTNTVGDAKEAIGQGLVAGMMAAVGGGKDFDSQMKKIVDVATRVGIAVGKGVVILKAYGMIMYHIIGAALVPFARSMMSTVQAIQAANAALHGNMGAARTFASRSASTAKSMFSDSLKHIKAIPGAIEDAKKGLASYDKMYAGLTTKGGTGEGAGGGGDEDAADTIKEKTVALVEAEKATYELTDTTKKYGDAISANKDKLSAINDEQTIRINQLGVEATELDNLNIALDTNAKTIAALTAAGAEYESSLNSLRSEIGGTDENIRQLTAQYAALVGTTKTAEAEIVRAKLDAARDLKKSQLDMAGNIRGEIAETLSARKLAESETTKIQTDALRVRQENSKRAEEERKRAAEESAREAERIAKEAEEAYKKETEQGISSRELEIRKISFQYRDDELKLAEKLIPLYAELAAYETSRGATEAETVGYMEQQVLLAEKIKAATPAAQMKKIEEDYKKKGAERKGAFDVQLALGFEPDAKAKLEADLNDLVEKYAAGLEVSSLYAISIPGIKDAEQIKQMKDKLAEMNQKVYFDTESAVRGSIRAALDGGDGIASFAERLGDAAKEKLTDSIMEALMPKGGDLFGKLLGGGKGGAGEGGAGILGSLGAVVPWLGVVGLLSSLGGKKSQSQPAPVQALPLGQERVTGGGNFDALRSSDIFGRATSRARNATGGEFQKWASSRTGEENAIGVNVTVDSAPEYEVKVTTRMIGNLKRAGVRGVRKGTGHNHFRD